MTTTSQQDPAAARREASPLDLVWGIGLAAADERAQDPQRWRGLNLLGFALMEARERLGGAGRGSVADVDRA